MKIISRLVIVALASTACSSDRDPASAGLSRAVRPAGYHVIALPPHGDRTTEGLSLNDAGWVAGTSTGEETVHASLWLLGVRLDLGTLGGPNSAVLWPVKNVIGVISGVAETADVDPNAEDWSCSAFFPTVTHHVCRGFVWQGGVMRPLDTFGGTHGFATGTNNLGQTVGWAENAVHDPTCNPPQLLQFRAALWEPGQDPPRELPPLTGDSTSSATALNDAGQVVGISGICANAVGGRSAAHAVMWENGSVTDLGSLGGVAWNTPMSINGSGDVVGFANRADASPPTRFRPLAFLWTEETGMRSLDVLPGDTRSQALGINDQRQVVGTSCAATCRGFIWEDDVMTDLNTLIVSGSPGTIEIAGDINAHGMITGRMRTSRGTTSAFIAFPR